MKKLFLTLLLISCSKPTVEPVEPETAPLEQLQDRLVKLLEVAFTLTDKNGWLVYDSCDSMLWSAKFGTSTVDYVNISAAEKPSTGKFYRTPSQTCFEENRSASTWSRDMSLGLLAFLISQGDLATIERHIEYGEANGWIMGEGAKSRTVYSPALISLWYKAAKTFGHNYGKIEVENVYTKGLTDYQAHLQMMDIYINGRLDGRISEVMLARIIEHSDRDTNSSFFRVLRSIYQGPIEPAVSICLDDDAPIGSHVRCDGEPCELAEEIFSCGILTKFLHDGE